MNKILLILLLFAAGITAAPAQIAKLMDFGAVPNDGISDDAAMTAARESLLRTGGTIEFPCGVTNLSASQNFAQYGNYVSWKLDGRQCATIEVRQTWLLFGFGNNPQIEIDGLTFTGRRVSSNHPDFTDAQQGIIQLNAEQNRIVNSKFLGLRSNNFIVRALGNTIIESSQFDGNSASAANVLTDSQWQKGLTVRSTRFIDYSNFMNSYLSKTGYGNGAWIKVTGGTAPVSASNQRQLRVEDCQFDEGAATAVHADNVFAVDLSGSSFNVAGTSRGRGVHLDNVKKARLAGNFFGWTGFARPAIVAVNNSLVLVEDIALGNQVYPAERDATSQIYFDARTCPDCASRVVTAP